MLTCPNCKFGNPETARFCNNCGTALEKPRAIEGERKFATVLFADVARSTAIAEQMDPEDWAVIMNGAFGFMNAAVSRFGGTVSRLMGDAVLALFGAPIAHEDDAERAVRAGLALQESARLYAQSVKQSHGVDFGLRVGINTGTAVLAFVGDAVKTEYTAMGDAANVAARLQSAAEPGTVLISAETYRLVHPLFDFRARGLIEMKGKATPVRSYVVLGPKAQPGSLRGLEGLSSPLVGRQKEIDLLRERFAALEAGTGSVVAIIGEAGLGKSRLVAELRETRDSLPDNTVGWYEARAISYGQSIPYYPWRQVGRQLIGAMEMDAVTVVRDKLGALMTRLNLPAEDGKFLETMLAVESDDNRFALADLPGETVVNGVAQAMVNAVRAAIRSHATTLPHVLIMDDLHWSDGPTLELIAQIAALTIAEPLMLVCVLRPDRKAPSWPLVDRLAGSLGAGFDRIDLEPLNPSASSELLGNLLHIEDLPLSIRQQILNRSEGNPFYLEEVLRSLIDAGQVVREAGHWRATRDIVDAKIPETLNGVLSARIDRLPEATKRVAQTAAVIGRVFMHRVLETVCRAAPASERVDPIEPHIAMLNFEQLVREKMRIPEREYIFKHAMTCEAAYGLLLKSRRRELHARAGAALESLFADRRDEFAPLLAHHFAEAEDLQRALNYSYKAANGAERLYALREELGHRERILTLLDRLPEVDAEQKIDAVIEWTEVRHKLSDYTGVVDRLDQAIALGRGLEDKSRLAIALSWAGNIQMASGFPSRAQRYLDESQALAMGLGDERLLLLPMFFATWTMVDRDPRVASEQLDEIIAMSKKAHMPDVMGHAMAYRAVALARIGDFAGSEKQLEEAYGQLPQAGPVRQADIHIAAAMAYYDMGQIEKGLEHARLGAEKAEGAGGLECACAGTYSIARGQLEQKKVQEALVNFGTSKQFADRAGWGSHNHLTYLIKAGTALAEFEQGTSGAIERLKGALQNAEASHDDYSAFTIGLQLSGTLLREGRWQEAEALLPNAIAYFEARKMRPYLAAALEIRAEIHAAAGRAADAVRDRAEAEEMRMPVMPAPGVNPAPVEVQVT